MKKYLYVFVFVFLILSINYSIAYSNTTLEHYFSMGDGYGWKAYDSKSGTSLRTISSSYNLNSVTGKVGNALNYPNTGSGVSLYNQSLFDFGSKPFTINLWIKQDSYISLLPDIGYGFNAQFIRFNSNSSAITNLQQCSVSTCGYSTLYPSSYNTTFGTWNMYTIVYSYSSYVTSIYVNGLFLGNFSYYNIPAYSTYFKIGMKDTSVDELSVWNTTLTSTDIQILYNNGVGLNYIETLLSGSGYANGSYTEPSNYTFSGLYHNYCWYNVLCSNYNVSNQVCDDEIRKVCVGYCVDTFSAYKSAGLENVTSDFSGECEGNEYYFQSPSYSGNTTLMFDVCVGSYLCHNYNITSNTPCPDYYKSQPNKVDCRLEKDSLVAECFDTFDIYAGLQTYPPYNNYTGRCSECVNDCSVENSTSCFDETHIQMCKRYRTCLKEFTIGSCESGQTCSNGACSVNVTCSGDSCDDGTGFTLSTPTKYWIMLLSSVLILLFMTILMASFGDGLSGLLVGLVLSILTSLTLTLIFELTLLIPVLYIVIGGSIVAVLMRRIFTGG